MKPSFCRFGSANSVLAVIMYFSFISALCGQVPENGGALPHDSSSDASLPFFHSWWFLVLFILTIVFVVISIVRWKTSKLNRQKKELSHLLQEKNKEISRQAKQLKDDLASPPVENEITLPHSISEDDLMWLKRFETVASENLNNPNFKAKELASALNLSRTQCFRKLKSITGMTPGAWLQEARLQKALKLLEGKKCDSVKAVAYEVGINPNYFSEAFKKRFGKLPSEYF